MGAYKKAGIWVSVLTPLLLFGLSTIHTTKASAAITGAVAMYQKATIVSIENSCTNNLNTLNRNGGTTPRDIVNKDKPYTPIYWISPRSSPTGTVVATTGSSSPIGLQLNNFEFLCAIVVKNNSNSSRITDPTSIVTNTRFPNDRPPTANNGNINSASLWGVNTHVNSAAVISGGGSISGINSADYLAANRDNNSRYWNAAPVPFTYNPGSAVLTNRTVTVRLNVTSINTYNAPPGAGVSQCSQKDNPTRVITIGSTQFASCQPTTINLTFKVITHGPNIVLTSGASCTVISGRAVDPDNPNAQVGIHVSEDGVLRWTGKTSGSTHSFSVATSTIIGGRAASSVDWTRHNFQIGALGVNGGGAADGANTTITIQIGPCGQISCNGSMTNFDPTVGVGNYTNFQVWVKETGAKTLPPANSFDITMTEPTTPRPTNNPFVPRTGLPPDSSGFIKTPVINYQIKYNGTYVVTWVYHYLSTSKTCTSTVKSGYHPFFTVQGGDIMAGTAFGDCGGNEVPADIKSWNNNTAIAPNYFGAGTAAGAWATGDITNFVSGMGLSGGAAANGGHGLSFANSNNAEANTAPNYGGKFGDDSLPCTHDYYGDHDADAPQPYTGGLDALDSGAYDATGTTTLGTGAPIVIPAGKSITLYVKGDVFIGSNITYGPYDLDSVPRFNLYVQGNIYISPSVSELHGVYIAQEDSGDNTTGIITTCAESIAANVEPYNVCAQKPLKVVGAMAAESELRLNRTQGSLTAANDPAAPGGTVPASPAEMFQYSPELWLTTAPQSQLQLQSYTSLPPVL